MNLTLDLSDIEVDKIFGEKRPFEGANILRNFEIFREKKPFEWANVVLSSPFHRHC